jgi:dTDP-4-amino-4,6-dideoxy-D-galactose acyltransferase
MRPEAIRFLDWDSRHFGVTVARLDSSAVGESLLAEYLEQARKVGIRLLYYFDAEHRPPDEATLERFSGRQVDDRVTFEALVVDAIDAAAQRAASGVQIREYSRAAATPELVELGIAAGALSRFRVDPRIPSGAFERLYREWVERSVRHEIADVVYIAESEGKQLLGLATVASGQGAGNVGLLAVAPAARGRGIGRQLLGEAHQWMALSGLDKSIIVTQADNAAACRLYASCGYRQVSREHIYHFWLASDVE